MFYDRFKLLCAQRGISCNKAAKDVGLSNATPTRWKKTGATPTGETLNKIAAYFGVTADYLLGQDAQKEAAAHKGSSFPVDAYERLSPENQAIIDRMIEALTNGKSQQ